MTVKKCKKCGAQDRYANGDCIRCHKERVGRYSSIVCSKCGKLDRYPSGPCRPCQLERSRNQDREKKRVSGEIYNHKNRVVRREKAREWRRENIEMARLRESNNEARRRRAGGALSKGIVALLFSEQGGKCPGCLIALSDYHVDHYMPIALGGLNNDNNVQLLCPTCNLKKGAKHPLEWSRIYLK